MRLGTRPSAKSARAERPARAARRDYWRRLPGLTFTAITQLPALLVMAWLLAGLPLLLAGRFRLAPMLIIFIPLAVALCFFALRQVRTEWPDSIGESEKKKQLPNVPWWPVISTVAVAAGFGAWQIAMNSQQVIVIRDPGTYLQFGYWIANHGSARIPQSLAAFGGAHPGLSFTSLGFYQRGGSVIPQFMAGLPMALAAAFWSGGTHAALLMGPIAGAGAVLSFAGLAGRLAGPRWAPAAALALAVTLPEQYTSRSTFSEPLAQVMLYGGLAMLADALLSRPGRHAPEGAPRPAKGAPRTRPAGPGPAVALAALGGLAIGLTVLIRIDGLSDLLPAIPFLAVLLVARRPQAIPFGIGLAIGVGYGLADGYLLSRPYLNSLAASLHPLAAAALDIAVISAAGIAVMAIPSARARIQRSVSAGPLRWLPQLAAAVIVLALAGFLARPYFQTVRGQTNPASIAYIGQIQRIDHLPVDPRRQYYEDSLYWVIWYVGLPAVLLGAFGMAALAKRCLKALLTWHDQNAAARIWALPLMIFGWVVLTVLWNPGITPDQPWASRRLVPVALPAFILTAVWASAWLKRRAVALGAGRAAAAAVASCCVLALLVPAAWTNFGIGLTKSGRPTAHGLAFKRTETGQVTAIRGLCGQIGSGATVVIIDPLTADRFSQVIRGMCDTPTGRIDNPTTATVHAVVTGIERAGGRPVLLSGCTSQAQLASCESQLASYGGTPREVLNLVTRQDTHELTQPPTTTWGINYIVLLSQPLGTG